MSPSPTSATGGPPALDSITGALLIGTIIAAALWGVTCVQTFTYYIQTPSHEDTFYIRALVAVVFVLDTLHQALISYTTYYYTISNFFHPLAGGHISWALIIEVEVNVINGLIVQSFYIWRIWKLSHKNYYIAGIIALSAVAGFIVTTIDTCIGFQLSGFSEVSRIQVISALVNTFAAVTDSLIAISIIYLLRSSRSGVERTDHMIDRLLVLVINTGFLTSLCSLGALISVLASPSSLIFLCFFFPLGRLYANSFLATLNTRASIRKDVALPTDHFWISMGDLRRTKYTNGVLSSPGGSSSLPKDSKLGGLAISEV